jgi:hypothetical protein
MGLMYIGYTFALTTWTGISRMSGKRIPRHPTPVQDKEDDKYLKTKIP